MRKKQREGAMENLKQLQVIEDLREENRELMDELRKIRPLARLASVIALMEASNARMHADLVKTERDLEDATFGLKVDSLETRVKALVAELQKKEASEGEG